jgi:asparagine synthase (glutamine-hydrolysing)
MPSIYGFLAPYPVDSATSRLDGLIANDMPMASHDFRVIGSHASVACSSHGHSGTCAAHQIGDIQIAYEGRPYWSENTAAEIRAASTLAEGIALAYRLLGPGLLEHLRGSYSLAILVPDRRQALLATDRMGIRPLAYAISSDGLVFASSALAVARHPGISAKLSPQAIHDYLYFHVVPSPETIFQGVSKLPPAHFALYDAGQISVKRYWSPAFDSSKASEYELSSMLRSQLEEAMDRQFNSAESAASGAFLSGGLDSSTVVGLLAKRSSSPTTAYTIGFEAEGYDEIPFARLSASHYGTQLKEYYVTPRDVETAMQLIAAGYDEPFGNASAIPAYFCAKMAREDGRSVLMAGDGGDEIFAGNERYLTQRVFEHFQALPAALQHMLKSALLSNAAGESITVIRKLRSYVRQAAIPLPERLNTYNFLRRTLPEDIFDPDFLRQIDTTRPDTEQRAIFITPDNADTLQRMLYLDWKYTLADNDLRKVNRAAELAGIEVRYPLLDDELVAFSATLPSELLMRGNSLRAFYKQSLRDFLPPHTIIKKKHGFGLPFGVWMASDARLNDMACDCLNRMKERHIIKTDYIDQLVHAQRTGHAAYYGVMIWVIVMLEQWLEAHKL